MTEVINIGLDNLGLQASLKKSYFSGFSKSEVDGLISTNMGGINSDIFEPTGVGLYYVTDGKLPAFNTSVIQNHNVFEDTLRKAGRDEPIFSEEFENLFLTVSTIMDLEKSVETNTKDLTFKTSPKIVVPEVDPGEFSNSSFMSLMAKHLENQTRRA